MVTNDRCCISILHFFCQPFWFFPFLFIPEKLINVYNAGTANQSFPAYMIKFFLQESVQLKIKFIAWRKITMPAFGCKGMVIFAIPIDSCFPQTCSWRNHGCIANRSFITTMYNGKIFFSQHGQSISSSFQVIYKLNVLYPEVIG